MAASDSIPRHLPEFPSLRRRLLDALGAVGPVAADGLVSLTVDAPWLHPRHLTLPDQGPGHHWARPAEEHHLLGMGACLTLESGGAERFQTLKREFARLAPRWHHHALEGAEGEPAALLEAAFDPEDPMAGVWWGLPNSRLTIPRVLARCHGPRRTLTFTARAAELADPVDLVEAWLERLPGGFEAGEGEACPMELVREDGAEERTLWNRRLSTALKEIASGGLEKVVVTRTARMRGERPFDADRILTVLSCMYPGCVLYGCRGEGHTLVAATPERLVSLEGGRVRSDALAGTRRRAADPEEDRRLAEGLLTDPKSRREHLLVREAIADALGHHCDEIRAPARPNLLRLRNLQHLHTPFEARPRPGASLLDLAAALHPTPAVGGAPTDEALRWLNREGNSRRGWYSGVVGWLSPKGEGELSVLLRCALLEGRRAHLFAGSGIVADSDPDAEWEESELKLAALLRALENG